VLPAIPDKQYFKIGEVSRIIEVKPHVLRYWESEFSAIRPQKSRTNQRLYRRRDVELLLDIKRLLYQEGYTIAGANKRLRELRRAKRKPLDRDAQEVMEGVRRRLEDLLELVEGDEA
jgi:DNA-binding transcriptional MerR regulator